MLTIRAIVLWSAGLLVIAGLAAMLLLWRLGGGRPEDVARLDALRTAATIVVGTGGAAALLLSARRQRSAELDLAQKDHDATEKRITEIYGKAADQLGSDKAPVRLAGLYSLERLAQDYQPQRQTIVNVICAYLRMPFTPDDKNDEARQELQVRQTAERLLHLHLQPGKDDDNAFFWPDIDLDLVSATLTKFKLTHCRIRSAVFHEATFIGDTLFRGTEFTSKADFKGAKFTGGTDFRSVTFSGMGETFTGATFENEVDFGEKTQAKLVGVITRTDHGHRRKWPQGYSERPIPDRPGYAELVLNPSSATELPDRLRLESSP
ncbi:Pentapeptide repeat-containing protein [Amycolatopsis xylanica]|uniref:Pentapeptide repeat-containing protein n=1 Tax=Amycolatopsis xylanica TaxID=589385 RepID=A0A1H3EJC2_9PSEU|nr:pentapeptide repeat-containing protein [Amycolatopsis xylanica]SDX78298.1 Pentapeptide repeat-containing protein [Amycolatopsis xylanica]